MPIYRKRGAGMGYKHYTKRTTRIDMNTIITVNEYHVPNNYKAAVESVLDTFRHSDLSFNQAVDQVAASRKSLNRNTLAKHALKYLANEY